jgi:O-antigen ligase
LFSERATELDEAAISSRWELLPKLWQKITEAPILGKGFGTTVTYQSRDPRQLASPGQGIYTTYTFEWGWFDIWLKLGFFGMLAYLALLIKFIAETFKNSKNNPSLFVGLGICLIVLAIVNFFTPYLNHPLGIGFILIAATFLRIDNS